VARFFEDFEVGDVYRSWVGRTVTEADNVWFTTLTMNTNQMHFNREWAERTEFGRPLVNSAFTLALVLGLAARDTSENAAANLGWSDIRLPKPVFVGDTLWAESEVLSVRDVRESSLVRHRLDPDARREPAPRGRDRVLAYLRGVPPRRARGRGRLSGDGRRVDRVRRRWISDRRARVRR
jgi:acyl dehydratase